MTLSILGKQYICENFGDASFCCTVSGLSWYYTIGTDDYPETGGTAQIVSRLASGLIDSLTMTNPTRGIFTQAELNAANQGTVTLQDAKEITSHDEPSEDQWCFIPCSTHTDQNTCENIYNCYWYNGACHADPPICTGLNNEPDCVRYNCYWYDGACHPTWTCESIMNSSDCVAYGCSWYNGSCHTNPPGCEELNNESDCVTYGCYWYNNSCHTSVNCEQINNETECQAYSCYWYNGSCHTSSPSCEELNNGADCLTYGCFWYRNACHSADQPELCYWIDQHWPLAIESVFEIIDSFLFATPPTGWAFVPTIGNVFGIIDYYLGFNGDQATGCNILGG